MSSLSLKVYIFGTFAKCTFILFFISYPPLKLVLVCSNTTNSCLQLSISERCRENYLILNVLLRDKNTKRETGFEPATYTLAMCRSSQLNYSRTWCRDPDLNWGHSVLQTDALPTELSRHY